MMHATEHYYQRRISELEQQLANANTAAGERVQAFIKEMDGERGYFDTACDCGTCSKAIERLIDVAAGRKPRA